MKKTALRLMWYSLYVIVEVLSLTMIATNYHYNPLSTGCVLLWVVMTIITCYVNLSERSK